MELRACGHGLKLSKGQGYRHPGWVYSLWASWLRWAGVPGLEKARAHLERGKDQLESRFKPGWGSEAITASQAR